MTGAATVADVQTLGVGLAARRDPSRLAQIQSADAASAPTLQLGHPIDRPLVGAEVHVYRLPLDAADVATLTVDQRGLDVVVRVEDAGGALLAEFDREARPDGPEPVIVIGDASGPVRVSVKPRYPKVPAGAYSIHVDAIHAAADRDRDEFEAHKLATAGVDLESAGKFKDALAAQTQALARAERALPPNDPYIGHLLARSAELSRTTGDTAASQRLFTRAIAVDEAALGREHPQTAYAILRLGALYTALDDYTKSEPLLDEALAITERTLGTAHPRIPSALMAGVMPHYFLEDYGYVIPRFERALAIAEKTLDADDFTVLALVNNLGDVYERMEQYDKAEPYDLRALAGLEKKFGPDNWRVANPLLTLGKIARQRQQYDHALELMWRAYGIREKTQGKESADTAAVLIIIGTIYHDKGDYTQALDTFHRALDALESRGPYFHYTLLALDDAAETYQAQGDVPHAIEYVLRANRLRDKQIALNLAVGSEREKLQYAESILASTSRTITLHVRQAPDNPAAAAEAVRTLLQRKGEVLDAMSGSMAALRDRMSAEDRAMLDQLGTATTQLATLALGGPGRTPIDEYKQQLASLEARREQLEAEVGRHSAEFRARSMPVTVDAVQQAIPAEAALIEFAVYQPYNPKSESSAATLYGEPRYVAYVLRHDGGIQWKELGDAHAIDKAVGALRQALRNPARRDVKTLARVVDEKVLQPIRPIVGDATRLLISPDGELNLIPFEALVDERQRYAIERFAISYLTSGRDLLRVQLPRASKTAPLIVADPAFGPALLATRAASRPPAKATAKLAALQADRSSTTGPDLSVVYFAPLPGTALEARAIKALFPDARVLSGAHATKSAVARTDAPALLHIATHGFFLRNADATDDTAAEGSRAGATAGATAAAGTARAANAGTSGTSGTAGTAGTRAIMAHAHVENPLLRSGLALSGANLNTNRTEAGILTALEASTLNLWGTRLVTLSGCDTGVGDIKNGEGVYGLRRAFLLAGAETLVMSLWSVNDYVTREMMTTYYGGLKRGLGRGDALRQAQRAMLARADRQHPFYWASFIQAGDWAPFDGRR